MAKSIKWVVLSIVCAIAAIFLYTKIDSEWSVRTNASIWLTILFFASATLAILFAFSAVEGEEGEGENKAEKPSGLQTNKFMQIKKFGGLSS